MAIAVFFVFFTGSAYAAAEWNFYGSARVSTFYSDWENDFLRAGNPILGTGADTSNYEQALNGNARIGAKIKVSDTLTGRFEYGTKYGSADVRILWGEWNFGAGSLGVGKHYTPLLMPYSNQVYNIFAMGKGDTNMSLFGMLYGNRESQIRLKFGNFQIAAVAPRVRVHYDFTSPATPGSTPISATLAIPGAQPNTEVKMPNFQAKYKLEFDSGHINLAGGYQNFEVVGGSKSYDVTSYVLAVGGRLNVGKAYFKGNLWGGQNVGNLADIFVGSQVFSTMSNAAAKDMDGAGTGFARWRDGTVAGTTQGITDNDALAFLAVAGYEIRKGLYVEGGYGYTKTKLDEVGATKDDAQTWYLQSTVFLAPGVFLTPEIGGLDGKDNNLDVFYAGIKWQINF